ncbi:MAG: MmcQ/YjbR family DNA-binding protein [Paracoccaceae bacterium]
MTRDAFNAFCKSLPHTTHVVQWGGSDVWKVGGKVFAICGLGTTDTPGITFKVSEMAFDILRDAPGIRPAPYMASRGLKWLQVTEPGAMSQDSLQDHLVASYDMVVAGLTKKNRLALGL